MITKFWCLKFTSGKYEGKFLSITSHHELISGVDSPLSSHTFPLRQRAEKYVEYNKINNVEVVGFELSLKVIEE